VSIFFTSFLHFFVLYFHQQTVVYLRHFAPVRLKEKARTKALALVSFLDLLEVARTAASYQVAIS